MLLLVFLAISANAMEILSGTFEVQFVNLPSLCDSAASFYTMHKCALVARAMHSGACKAVQSSLASSQNPESSEGAVHCTGYRRNTALEVLHVDTTDIGSVGNAGSTAGNAGNAGSVTALGTADADHLSTLTLVFRIVLPDWPSKRQSVLDNLASAAGVLEPWGGGLFASNADFSGTANSTGSISNGTTQSSSNTTNSTAYPDSIFVSMPDVLVKANSEIMHLPVLAQQRVAAFSSNTTANIFLLQTETTVSLSGGNSFVDWRDNPMAGVGAQLGTLTFFAAFSENQENTTINSFFAALSTAWHSAVSMNGTAEMNVTAGNGTTIESQFPSESSILAELNSLQNTPSLTAYKNAFLFTLWQNSPLSAQNVFAYLDGPLPRDVPRIRRNVYEKAATTGYC